MTDQLKTNLHNIFHNVTNNNCNLTDKFNTLLLLKFNFMADKVEKQQQKIKQIL